MKTILLIAFASLLSVSAYAHCGSCGVGDSKDAHGDNAAACKACPSDAKCDHSKKKSEAKAEGEKKAGGACCPMSGKDS